MPAWFCINKVTPPFLYWSDPLSVGHALLWGFQEWWCVVLSSPKSPLWAKAVICLMAGMIRGVIWGMECPVFNLLTQVQSLWPCLHQHWVPANWAEHPSSETHPWKPQPGMNSSHSLRFCLLFMSEIFQKFRKKIHSISRLERILIKMF